ncbi:DUF6515 family protein [Desulfococcus sp.]|uniref:DUF6515 family protein n=1 Tax=Desulfococcus sp. TaxID=2025834 RepID=UPI00359390FD
MRYMTTTSIHKAAAWLIYLLAFTTAAGVGYADDFRHNGGGSDRGGRRYEGHRDQNRPHRAGEYRGGKPQDGDRGQDRSRRAGEYRKRAGTPHGGPVRNDGPDSRYKKRWDHDDRNARYKKRWDYDGRNSRYKKNWGNHRPPARIYPAPGYHRYPKNAYRRHVCGPGAGCYHPPRRPYYWRHSSGYFSVRPAIGTLFLTLPLGCAGLFIGGSIFYYHDDVYYRPVSSGYVVIAPPAAPVPPLVSGKALYSQVSVTVELLNVRSGPGGDHAVFRQVRRGEILDIEEESDGWLYVTLPGGEKGWIDAQYAAPMVYVDE